MRGNIARAITAALATAGAAGAIALPTLTLGGAKSPTHAFAIPAPADAVVIQAESLPAAARAVELLPPAHGRAATPPVLAPRSVAPSARSAPVASPRPAASAPGAVPEATPVPAPAPAPAPLPTPEPEPTPELQAVPAPAPEPSAATFAVSTAPEQTAGVDAADTVSKQHRRHKVDKGDRAHRKLEQARKDAIPPTDAVVPVEPLPADEADQVEAEPDGKEHGHQGKGNGKKK